MTTPTKLAVQFATDLRDALRGVQVDPLRTMHPDVDFRHPVVGVFKGRDNLSRALGPEMARLWKCIPTGGFYVVDTIEEDDRVFMVAMSHYEGVSSRIPYNNVYMFLMKVRDGMIIEVDECFDNAIVRRSGDNVHLEW